MLVELDDVDLMRSFLGSAMLVDPDEGLDKSFLQFCKRHGWNLFRAELLKITGAVSPDSIERNLGRAKGGLETWQRRVRLARTAAQDALADKAIPRVEGLLKVIDQLERELREVMGLRERFASPAPLTAADRNAAARFLSPGTATSGDEVRWRLKKRTFSSWPRKYPERSVSD